jgi:hypothetical protein
VGRLHRLRAARHIHNGKPVVVKAYTRGKKFAVRIRTAMRHGAPCGAHLGSVDRIGAFQIYTPVN